MRRRLVLAIGGVATAAVVLFGTPLAFELERGYRDEELLRLQRDTIAATREIDVGAGTRDRIELPAGADDLGVYTLGGRRLVGRGPQRADALVRGVLRTARPATRSTDGKLLAAIPLVADEKVSGVVRAARADASVARRAHEAWLALSGLALAVVLLAGLAAWILAHRLSAPLERLAGAARRLGEGDFGARTTPAGVPEVDAVARALDATAVRLEELVSRERAFSADASHQLRTPLAALRLELESVELRGDPPPELPAALAQVDRLQSTVETLLSVARDAPRPDQKTELEALLDEMERRWRGALASDARPLRMVVETEQTVARAGPAVVSEILDVLLSNAQRHGAGAVTVSVRATRGWLAVDVADEGAGLTGDAERAFGRRSGSASGHGIGLALARSLAHAESGRLLVSRAAPEPVFTLLLAQADG